MKVFYYKLGFYINNYLIVSIHLKFEFLLWAMGRQTNLKLCSFCEYWVTATAISICTFGHKFSNQIQKNCLSTDNFMVHMSHDLGYWSHQFINPIFKYCRLNVSDIISMLFFACVSFWLKTF